MNPIEPILTTEEPRYDPERASRPRIKVLKTPYSDDPMTEGTTFQIFGCVYICYAKKTRGRSMVRYLGLMDDGKDKVFEKYKDDLALDDDGQAKVDKDIENTARLKKELGNLEHAVTAFPESGGLENGQS